MEFVAGIALSGSSLFSYNKSNFKYDREQRLKKEFREQRMRLAQADLWREDIRDMLKLTQRKLEMYMLVSVLMLSFAVSLWCEGHLPEGVTPQWLMLGYQIAIGGAFTFLLLAVWLATYATVAAQSYATRLLTQLVRLPVPTWKEIEASRTYASEYESIQPKQMFRVPFLTGHQERHVAKGPSATTTSMARTTVHGAGGTTARVDGSAVDPWGLERKGACPELESGGSTGEDVARLRHVKLMRQASQHWQTYDAFSRVSMSVGVNQLMLAISYFIVGFVLIELEATWAAMAGVVTLIVMAEVIILLDLTIPKNHQRLLTIIQLGPLVMLVAAYEGSQGTEQGEHAAEFLASVAFLLHAGFLAMVASFCAVKEHTNGAMLPFAFRGVLYLDAFAWVPKDSLDIDEDENGRLTGDAQRQADRDNMAELLDLEEYGETAPSTIPTAQGVERKLNTAAIQQLPQQQPGHEPLTKQASYYALDFMDPEVNIEEVKKEHDDRAEDDRSAKQHSLVRDAYGKHRPSCPRDFKDPGAAQDMRREDGAPRMWDHVSADSVPEKGFYDAISWLPTATQQKLPENNFKGAPGDAEPGVGGRAELDVLGRDIFEPITGHDKEKPGILPWKIFSYAIFMLCLVWFWAGVSTVFSVSLTHIAWSSEGSAKSTGRGQASSATGFASLLSLHAAHSSTATHHAITRMNVSWPSPGTTPKTLSCDASGQRFAATDGLSTFFAELEGGSEEAELHEKAANAQSIARSQAPLALRFKPAPRCQSTRGETPQDLALFCPSLDTCEALVLTRRGRKVTACPLSPGTEVGSLEATRNISQTWLSPEASGRGHTEPTPERVSWVFLDPQCASVGGAAALSDGCADIATSHGRVAQLTKDHGVVPFEGLEPITGFGQPDSVRALGRGVGVLQDRRVEVLDDTGSLQDTFSLPNGALPAGFCVGGGYLHVLGSGPGPMTIWRSELPEHLGHGKK